MSEYAIKKKCKKCLSNLLREPFEDLEYGWIWITYCKKCGDKAEVKKDKKSPLPTEDQVEEIKEKYQRWV